VFDIRQESSERTLGFARTKSQGDQGRAIFNERGSRPCAHLILLKRVPPTRL
jgi:hypothetical protein